MDLNEHCSWTSFCGCIFAINQLRRISDIAAKEMSVPSKLIEHVAARILSKILSEFLQIKSAGITIKKPNPPMNTYADSVQYILEKHR